MAYKPPGLIISNSTGTHFKVFVRNKPDKVLLEVFFQNNILLTIDLALHHCCPMINHINLNQTFFKGTFPTDVTQGA